MNILNATQTGSPLLSRAWGHSDFTKMTLTASRLQSLDGGYSLLASTTGQVSNSPLLSSEQFGYGGSVFGRAYDFSELSGDDGVAFSIELRTPAYTLFDSAQVQPFTYYDIGKVWNLIPGGADLSAASAGAGFRVQLLTHVQLEFTLAKPLTRTPSLPILGAHGDDPRIGISAKLTQ